jgi:hypothetical protein
LLSIDNAQLGSDKQALPKMAEANQLARLVVFALLGYFALTAAGTFVFTFVW